MARVTWTAKRYDARAGDEGPVVVREAACGRIICIVPGSLARGRGNGDAACLLDEDDVIAIRRILAAPRMRQILTIMRTWHARMGGWRPAI
jgi:hypothetical protein